MSGVQVLQTKPPDAPPPTAPPEGVKVTTGVDGMQRAAADPSVPASAAGAAKADAGQPSLIGGKFKTQEDLLNAYKALESKLGKPEPTKADPPTPAPIIDPVKTVADAGLDMKALETEFATTGDLSKDSLSKLEAKGITKATVDEYIAGQKARVDAYTKAVDEVVGGEAARKALFDWAGANLSKGEIEVANKAFQSMNPAEAGLVMQGLQARYAKANGTPPKLVNAQALGVSSGVKPFGSTTEVADAMSDRRYRSGDPAYHAEIKARLAASKF